jgi:hypothetical protein
MNTGLNFIGVKTWVIVENENIAGKWPGVFMKPDDLSFFSLVDPAVGATA